MAYYYLCTNEDQINSQVRKSYSSVPLVPVDPPDDSKYVVVDQNYLNETEVERLFTDHPHAKPQWNSPLKLYTNWKWDKRGVFLVESETQGWVSFHVANGHTGGAEYLKVTVRDNKIYIVDAFYYVS